jgi:hypothetical protein
MAGTGVGRMLVIPGRSTVSESARSRQGADRCLDDEGTLNSERRVEKKAGADQNGSPLSLMIVIEQWICLVLGLICMVSGTLGIAMNSGQDDLPAILAWAGLGYVPMLRITAVACLALGAVLTRLGWTHPLTAPGTRFHTQIVKEVPDEKRR